jgi:hypothetical protein
VPRWSIQTSHPFTLSKGLKRILERSSWRWSVPGIMSVAHSKRNPKLPCWGTVLIKFRHYAYEEVLLHAYLTATLCDDDWCASLPGFLIPWERAPDICKRKRQSCPCAYLIKLYVKKAYGGVKV